MRISPSLVHTFSNQVLVGTAGWSLPREDKTHFPQEGTHLERYASVFPAVEINSSFYRPHRQTTYARWAASVPPEFRFAVKMPKAITHTARLRNVEAAVTAFLEEISGLGCKLGCLLVQLPPSLRFEESEASDFAGLLRRATDTPVALEPRHASWFETPVEQMLDMHRIARVAADPAPVAEAAMPGGWGGLRYYRLHGSPRVYYSNYEKPFLRDLEERVTAASSAKVWCIFDNTASGAAFPNARWLMYALKNAG